MLLARDRESTSFHLCWSKEKKFSPVLMPALIFSKQFYRFEIETRGEQTRLKSAWPHITEGGIKLCPTTNHTKQLTASNMSKFHPLVNHPKDLTRAAEFRLRRHTGGHLPAWAGTQKGVQQHWHKGARTHGGAEWSGPGPDLSSSPLAAALGHSAQCGTAWNWWTEPGREGAWRQSTKDAILKNNVKF